MKTTDCFIVLCLFFAGMALAQEHGKVEIEDGRWTDCPAAGKSPGDVYCHSILYYYAPDLPPETPGKKSGEGVSFDPPVGPVGEGRGKLLFDSDSYPRERATLKDGPTVTAQDGVFRIAFAVSSFDDVMVRITDAGGKSLRELGCGVLGSNAPEPFQKNSLVQSVAWDGKDKDGKAVTGDWRVEVGVGLQPAFEKFLGHDPAQLTPYLKGLSIDRQGRVYAALSNAPRADPAILRFDRDGNYIDMVYPSNPGQLKAMNKKMADVYSHVETIEGHEVPIFEFTRGGTGRGAIYWYEHPKWIPFGISPKTDKGYFLDLIDSNTTPIGTGNTFNVFQVENLDHFWLFPKVAWSPMHIPLWYNCMTFDREGMAYLAYDSNPGIHGYIGGDRKAKGCIVKLNPETGEMVDSFRFLGKKELDRPTYNLGTPYMVTEYYPTDRKVSRYPATDHAHFAYFKDRTKPDGPVLPKIDSDTHFFDVKSIAVDPAGNILVADGIPPRIKMFDKEGRWLGEIGRLPVDGKQREFFDLVSLASGNGATYVLTSFWNGSEADADRIYLLKVKGLVEGNPQVVWARPFGKHSRFIVVDENAPTPLIWIGGGGGPGTLTRIEDRGATASVRHIGGIADGTVVDPWLVAAGEDGKVFVYDYARHQVIATDLEGADWKTVDVDPASPLYEHEERYRWRAWNDAYGRFYDQPPTAMAVDDRHRRLYVFQQTGGDRGGQVYKTDELMQKWVPYTVAKGLQVFDWNLNSQPVRLKTNLKGWQARSAMGTTKGIEWHRPFDQYNIAGVAVHDGKLFAVAPKTDRVWTRDKLKGEVGELGANIEVWDTLTGENLTDQYRGRYQRFVSTGSMTIDSKGNSYFVDLPSVETKLIGGLTFSFPNAAVYWGNRNTKDSYHWYWHVGDKKFPVTHPSELRYVVKFNEKGGSRLKGTEEWALKGAWEAYSCDKCKFTSNLLACDGADRIMVGDVDHAAVKVLDTAGNLIQRIGTYGNAQTLPADGKNTRDLGLNYIWNIAAAGDRLFVVDRVLHRVAVIRMGYREKKQVDVARASSP
jgi:hypothetical protein